jgi:hypothetical protein
MTSNRGNALISVIIAAAIIAILMSVLATMLSNVNREQSYTQQKSDSLTAQALITQGIINNIANCTLSVQNKPFSLSSPPTTVTLNELAIGPSATPSAIVKTTSSNMTGGLVVNSIIIRDILPEGIIGNYKGNVEIQFNNKVRQTKNMVFPIFFTVSVATNKISGCRVNSPPSNVVVLNLGGIQNYPAGSCTGGWMITPSLTVTRLDCNSNTIWVGVAIPNIDGTLRYDLAVEFGSRKSGGNGHGWHYFTRGLSNRQYLDPVSLNPSLVHNIGLEFYIGERINTGAGPASFSQWIPATPATGNACIQLTDTKLMIECLN